MRFSKSLAGIALVLATTAVACGDATEGETAPDSPNDCVGCDDGRFVPDGDPTPQEECAALQAGFDVVTPTVVLLVDQSASMKSEYDDGVSRWDALEGALMDPSTGIVKTLEDEVSFGLALYTSYDGFDGGTCPSMTEVSAGFGNYEAMRDAYASADPQEDTPTGAAIVAAADALSAADATGPKIIIVATDGEPDTCAEPDPQNGQDEAIAGAEYAYDLGIRTFVLGVGRDVSAAHLQDLANAGGGLAVDAQQIETYYQPDNQQDLVNAFGSIIEGQRSCVLPIDGTIDPQNVSGEVTIDGELVPMGDDGWKARDANHIELVGAACDLVMSGSHEVSGTFDCDVVVDVDAPR